MFLYFDGSDQIEMVGDRIDPEVQNSKRGSSIYDLSGSMFGCTEKGSDFMLSFARDSHSPAHISILCPNAKFIVSHRQKWALESYADTDWKWHQIPIEENLLVSYTTKKLASDILTKGKCQLPTLFECFPAHQFILDSLLPHFCRLLKNNLDYCPVT